MTKLTSRKATDFTDSVEITPADLKIWENKLDLLTNTTPPYRNYTNYEDAFDPGYMTEEEFTGIPPATCTVADAINVLTQLQYHAGKDAPLTVYGKAIDVCDFCAHVTA